MRLPRSRQFDNQAPPWLHCVSRCVRRAFLCGEGCEHRRQWIENRLRLLSTIFAVDCAAYAVLSNHLHVVIRPRPDQVAAWSDLDVAEAWVHIKDAPLSGGSESAADSQALPALDHAQRVHAERLSKDLEFVAAWRERFASVSWFMKTLKEPIARAANKEDDCTGAFWEGRFHSTPLLDEAALVTCMAYVDLNPIRAGIAAQLTESVHTSAAARIQHRVARQRAQHHAAAGQMDEAAASLKGVGMRLPIGGRLNQLDAGRDDQASVPWLTPLSGLLPGTSHFDPDAYLRLLDATGRIIRDDKYGAIPAGSAALLDQLACDHDAWIAVMTKPKSLAGAVLGRLAAREQEIRRRCCRWIQVRCPLFA